MKKARLGEWNLQQGRLSSFQDFSPENDEKLSIKRGNYKVNMWPKHFSIVSKHAFWNI